MIVQLSLIKDQYSFTLFQPDSSEVLQKLVWTTNDLNVYKENVIDVLTQTNIRLCLKEADLHVAVFALQNTW